MRLGHGVALIIPKKVLRRRGIPRTVIADKAARLDEYISGHVQRQKRHLLFSRIPATISAHQDIGQNDEPKTARA